MATEQEKVEFLKRLFPGKMYSYRQLAKTLDCSIHTVEYWVAAWEVPTLKLTGTPRVMQDSLIKMFLKADKKNHSDERRVGLEFVIDDARE